MTPREFTDDFRNRAAQLAANRDRECLQISTEFKALIQLRVQTRGDNYQDQPFSPYTPGHSNRRARLGYQTDYVDFTMPGRLWANIIPQVESSTAQQTTVEITARSQENQAKLQGAARKRGNILLPSRDEIALPVRLNTERIRKYFP